MRYLIVMFLFVAGCNFSYHESSCPVNMFENVTYYDIDPNVATFSGYQVDNRHNFYVDYALLDRRINNIKNCLFNLHMRYPVLTDAQRDTWQCLSNNFYRGFNRECMVIKVVEPVYTLCSSEQHIRVSEYGPMAYADPSLCEEKGLMVTPSCPCVWRTALQDDWTIITPPKLHLWDIVRAQTGCNNVWHSPLAECASL